MDDSLKTPRLILKRLSTSNSQELFNITKDPEVMKYWIGGKYKVIEQATKKINDVNTHWTKHSFGDWGVFNSNTENLIGLCGLHYIPFMTEVNIGYIFKKSEWGKGYAYESCKTIINFGFKSLNLDCIVAVIWSDNKASIKLAEKLGLIFWKNIVWQSGDRVVYRQPHRQRMKLLSANYTN